MSYRSLSHRTSVAALLALASLAVGACADTNEPEPEPDIQAIVITSGTSSVTIPATGAQTPGALQLKANTANAVSIQFRNGAGVDEPLVAAERDELEVRLTVGTTVVTMTAGTGATFTGNVTPPTTGPAAYTLILFNTEHGHAEVSKTLTVNVVP